MSKLVLPTDPAESNAAPPAGLAAWLRKRAIVKGVLLAGLVMFVAEVLRIFVGANFHVVVPGKCYRSAQPTPEMLKSFQRTHGIRSIVNLRDENEGERWYDDEKHAADQLGIQLLNAGLSTKEQPPDEDFRRFVRAMRDAPEPILIHCANGNDRTGLASAVYLLMRTPTSLKEARGQLSLRYGHFALGKALCLHRILDNYESWLVENHREHSPAQFAYWGLNVYRQEDPP